MSSAYTVAATDWEQLAEAMVGLGRIQRRGLYGNTKMEIAHHLLRSEIEQVTYWQTMQSCILAS